MKTQRNVLAAMACLAILAAFPALSLAQIPEPKPSCDCQLTFRGWVNDSSLKARWLDKDSVGFKYKNVDYICRCVNGCPVCKPKDSSASNGASNGSASDPLSGIDLSKFTPEQQVALVATQSLIKGLFGSLLGDEKADAAAKEAEKKRQEDALRQEQEKLARQEAERAQALERWNAYQDEEKERARQEREDARKSGQELLARTGGQGLQFQSISGGGFESSLLPSGKYSSPETALGQAQCASYFSAKAQQLEKDGKPEEARFMSLQAQKAMSGETLDVPCHVSAASGAGTGSARSAAVKEILNQYDVKVKELLEISRQLAEVRKQKIEAQYGIKEADARIQEIKDKAAAATAPEEKQQCDDLLKEAEALRTQSETLLKVATENENACLTSARETESKVQELNTKLKESKDTK
ncbi:MAG: hypothetical protein ABFD80_11650 [Acidobacteriota bacterium]